MTSQKNAQTNQQPKSKKPQKSGILQRVAVRSVANAEMQSINENEALALSNSAFSNDFSRVPISTTKPAQIMAKLMIGAVGDKYEQEADRVAAQVVQRINAPASLQSGESETAQRQEKGTKDNKTKLMRSPIVQRMSSDAGIAAAPDLEASINQARGGGQPMADNIRKPMEQAFGADFSGVKVHTDGQSDQLNRSIQARAFTTGRDVFFRQGEYNPGSRDGQELIAHELTHVVQQKGEAVQGKQICWNRASGRANGVAHKEHFRQMDEANVKSNGTDQKSGVLTSLAKGSGKKSGGTNFAMVQGMWITLEDKQTRIETLEQLNQAVKDLGYKKPFESSNFKNATPEKINELITGLKETLYQSIRRKDIKEMIESEVNQKFVNPANAELKDNGVSQAWVILGSKTTEFAWKALVEIANGDNTKVHKTNKHDKSMTDDTPYVHDEGNNYICTYEIESEMNWDGKPIIKVLKQGNVNDGEHRVS